MATWTIVGPIKPTEFLRSQSSLRPPSHRSSVVVDSEQKADGEAVAEQTANAEEEKADAELLRKNKESWTYLIMRIELEQAEDDPEQLDADGEAVAEQAAINAEAKTDTRLLKKYKEVWAYLIIFFLHLHGCSVRSNVSALQSYDINSIMEGEIARCIKGNELLTYKDVLPDKNWKQSKFKFNEIPKSIVECINRDLSKLRMDSSAAAGQRR
ncbi:hypothetical protein MMC29_001093 [Sticta canariensis]|nr:hypothetical protein [Sticta canariensis]